MIWFLLVLLLAGFAAPFVIERRRVEMDDIERVDAPGEFAALPGGVTHYQWHGPEDGPVLVCIHGLTTPSHVWQQLLPGLTQAGFRVLTYDLWGRGYSDRPQGAQDAGFFIRQLDELLADQGVAGPVMLMGYSMGGAVAAAWAAARIERVARLILLASAGMGHDLGPLESLARRVPVLGDWLILTFGPGSLLRGWARHDGPPELIARLVDQQRLENTWRGYLPAVMSSQRHLLGAPLRDAHLAVAAAGLPVAAIWAERDDVIPLRAMGLLGEWNRAARQDVIAGAGHGLPYTHPTEVLESLSHLLS